MFNFDTSALPDTATVTVVEFYMKNSDTQPEPETSKWDLYIGSFIDGSLDGTQGEYDGGTIMLDDVTVFTEQWWDLSAGGNDPTGHVSLTGETDIKIVDDSTGIGNTGHNFNTSKVKCQLRVTYTDVSRRRTGLVKLLPDWLIKKLFTKTMVFEPI
jgi:hypothetical protein